MYNIIKVSFFTYKTLKPADAPDIACMNILASRNRHSGILETGVLDTETSIDWLDYPASETEFLSSPKPLAVR